jgi:hypothetical protein
VAVSTVLATFAALGVPTIASAEDSWCCFRMIASAQGAWQGSYGDNPQDSINGAESMSWGWESRSIVELVRQGNRHELISARRRSGRQAAPGVWKGYMASETSVQSYGALHPVSCENGAQSHAIRIGDPRLAQSGDFALIEPRRHVPEGIQRLYPGTSSFLRVSGGLSIRHLCAYGLGAYTMPGGSEQAYDLAHLRAPPPRRFKQASHDEASRSERRFDAPPYDESWALEPGDISSSPNYLARGSYKARVQFVGFPRKRLRAETRALREYANGG